MWQAQFEACDYAVLKLFTNVRAVQFARIGGDVDPKLARWLEEQMMLPKEDGCLGDDGCAVWKSRGEILCGRCFDKVSSAGMGILQVQEVM